MHCLLGSLAGLAKLPWLPPKRMSNPWLQRAWSVLSVGNDSCRAILPPTTLELVPVYQGTQTAATTTSVQPQQQQPAEVDWTALQRQPGWITEQGSYFRLAAGWQCTAAEWDKQQHQQQATHVAGHPSSQVSLAQLACQQYAGSNSYSSHAGTRSGCSSSGVGFAHSPVLGQFEPPTASTQQADTTANMAILINGRWVGAWDRESGCIDVYMLCLPCCELRCRNAIPFCRV